MLVSTNIAGIFIALFSACRNNIYIQQLPVSLNTEPHHLVRAVTHLLNNFAPLVNHIAIDGANNIAFSQASLAGRTVFQYPADFRR